ncbi:hypothetical protein JB92DRAFT_2848746 [Gautieria morchelliformis]|nr:hypothetical protein JB92DRAFT_2848746 [Gautieria morchelliformis]
MKCPNVAVATVCSGARGCCSNNEIQGIAIASLCGNYYADGLAQVQYDLNAQIALCHFDGHSTDNVQLQLTPDASAILDSMNRLDEQLGEQQAIYRALQIIGGHIGLPILLIFSIFPKKTRRNVTFLSFCFTWILSSITFSIGLYRLGPASRCLIQAALVPGTQAMTDTAMCSLIVQMWLDIRAAIYGPRKPGQIRRTRIAAVERAFIFSQLNFYCFLSLSRILVLCQYILLFVILMVTLILDVCIIRILYRHWRFFRRTGEKGLQISLSVILRVIFFCVYRVVVAVAYVATMLSAWRMLIPSGPKGIGLSFIPVWVDMLQAGTPLVAFLIFGTSKEFLDALMFWKRFN